MGPAMDKLKRCTPTLNPPDQVMKALVELVERQGWSNSLQDLASSIGALKDDEVMFKKNTDLVLMAILDRLANSREWKLMEMCHRHELKYVVNTSLSCSHWWNHQTNRRNPESDTSEWTLPIDCSEASLDNKMTQADLQEQIVRFNSQTTQVECKVCQKEVELRVFLTVPHACDPDFLTLVCDKSVSLKHRHVTIQFSKSKYRVKAITHWDNERRMAAVSREKLDGTWWWHGVEKSQAPEYKFTDEQLEAGLHLKDVAVLFGVRIDSEEEEGVSLGDDQMLEGDLEEAGVEDFGVGDGREETINPGEVLKCHYLFGIQQLNALFYSLQFIFLSNLTMLLHVATQIVTA